MKFGFYRNYAVLAGCLFLVELGIALFVHDRFIRPFVGDLLVVVLIFAACRTFVEASHPKLAFAVLLFAFSVEFAQYFEAIAWLGWENNRLARVVLGATFDRSDLLAYALGALLVGLTGRGRPNGR